MSTVSKEKLQTLFSEYGAIESIQFSNPIGERQESVASICFAGDAIAASNVARKAVLKANGSIIGTATMKVFFDFEGLRIFI
jgi:hypothetical protein